MGSENIFDIWRFLGKGTPFIVRRNGWFHLSYKVTKVIPKGKYGEAFGYRLTDGKFEVDTPQEEPIGCCGCGNWELIENLIEDVDALSLIHILMNSKARLQTKIGDTLGADKSKMEEEKYNKEGEKRSGGKVFRAMRMN